MKNKLKIFQNKVVRFILGLHHRKNITYIEFEKLGFLKISNRVKQLRLNHVHNILNNKCPDYMHKMFTKELSSHSTRSSSMNYNIPSIKGCESTTFYYSGIKDWNSLPESVKNCNVKKYLMEKLKNSYQSEFIFY